MNCSLNTHLNCSSPLPYGQNYKLKLKNDDYKNMDPETALKVGDIWGGVICDGSVVYSLFL